jgi:lysophospholipase L1-like esterase
VQTITFVIGYYDSNDNQISNESLTTRQLDVNSLEELDLSFIPKDIANASYLRLGVVSEKNKLVDVFITDITFKPSFNNDIKWIKNGNLTRLNTGNAVGERGMTLSVLPDFNKKGWLKASWKNSTFARVTWTLPLDKIKKIGSANLLVKLNLFANQDSDNIGIRLSTYGTSTINKDISFPVKKGKLYKKNITLPLNLTYYINYIKLFVFDIKGNKTDGEILISDISLDLIRSTTIDDSPEFKAVEDLIAFGDSITWGLHSSDNTVNSWTANLMAYGDINITNTAISGATWQHQDNKTSSIVDVIQATDVTNVRNIIAFGGTNDFAQDLPVGTIDDTDPTTLYGAMNVGIQSIYERNPKVSIYLVTPMWRARINDANSPVDVETTPNSVGLYLRNYVEAVIAIGKKYHLPVLDLYHELPINQYNSTSLLADGLHPNDDGYVLLAKKIGKFLNGN